VIFFDTSVLIAAIQVGHTHHQPSRKLFHILGENKAATSVHALAEVYATLTRMPLGLRLSPFDTINAIEALLKKLTPVALSPEEYLTTLRITAKLGHSSGRSTMLFIWHAHTRLRPSTSIPGTLNIFALWLPTLPTELSHPN